jgi:hypothetical protein
MRARSVASLAGGGVMWTVIACGEVHPSGDASAPESSTDVLSEAAGGKVRTQELLDPAARRVRVIVLPGDASVEVNGIPTRRRDGVIELAGKVGTSFRVRVYKDRQSFDQTVVIPAPGDSPPILDLAHPLARSGDGGAKVDGGPGDAGPGDGGPVDAGPVDAGPRASAAPGASRSGPPQHLPKDRPPHLPESRPPLPSKP